MLHIILDTNIYRHAPRLDTPEFKTLSYMVRKQCIRIHIPFIVEREFSTHLEIEQRKKIADAATSIRKALNFEGKGPKSKELAWILEKLDSDIDEIVAERNAAFIAWLSANNVERHALTLEQSQTALEAYFSGQPPLKEPKSRKDIPDAFIYQKVVELKDLYSADLRVIAEDGKLRNACCQQGIISFSDLPEFLASDDAKECLKQKLIDDNKSRVLEQVRQLAKGDTEKIKEETESLLLSGEYGTITGDRVPGENYEIFVCSGGTPYSIEITEIAYLGGGLFVVYFSAAVELDYSYAMSIMDSLELNREKYSVHPLNEHYVEVETSDIFLFSGQAEFEFHEQILDSNTIEEMLAGMKEPKMRVIELDDFEVEWLDDAEV